MGLKIFDKLSLQLYIKKILLIFRTAALAFNIATVLCQEPGRIIHSAEL